MEKIVWKNDIFNGITINKLHEMGGIKEIRINLQKDSEMKEHQAPGEIVI